MNMEPVSDDIATIMVCALVCKIDLARWTEVKRALRDAGGQLIFQKIAPIGVFLRIEEEVRA